MSVHQLQPELHQASMQSYVTVDIAGQVFGLEILRVQDVFLIDTMTAVPLASPEIAGVLNLRGRIVTMIDMRTLLGLPPSETGSAPMAVGIEHKGESYGLIIDQIGDVLELDAGDREHNPSNLHRRWAGVADGVYQLDGKLMVVLNVERVLAGADMAAA